MNDLGPSEAARRGAFWLITLASCAAIGLTASLGHWQLSRAAQKIALSSEMAARGGKALLTTESLGNALAASEPVKSSEELLFRKVRLRGRWQTDKTVFLDNRQMQGRQGFLVLTPLMLDGTSNNSVLVQRGWAPRNFENRSALPAIDTEADEVVVMGHLAPEPSHTFSLGGDRSKSEFEHIRQNLVVSDFRDETGLLLANVTVVQEGAGSEGLLRDWPAPATGVERHYGYAFQWFALCVLISGLYVWFQIVRPYRLRRCK